MITLESDIGTRLTSVRADVNPAPETVPTASGAATVTVCFPSGVSVSNYFKYSPAARAWFIFDYDPATGIGAEIFSDRIVLYFVDGRLGDEDRDATNGIIVDPGGPASISLNISSSSGGGGGGCSLRTRPMMSESNNSRVAADLVALLLGLLIWYAIRYAGQRPRTTDRILTYGKLSGTERPESEPAGQS